MDELKQQIQLLKELVEIQRQTIEALKAQPPKVVYQQYGQNYQQYYYPQYQQNQYQQWPPTGALRFITFSNNLAPLVSY